MIDPARPSRSHSFGKHSFEPAIAFRRAIAMMLTPLALCRTQVAAPNESN